MLFASMRPEHSRIQPFSLSNTTLSLLVRFCSIHTHTCARECALLPKFCLLLTLTNVNNRWWTWRICCRHQGWPTWAQDGMCGNAWNARRDLSERWVHPQQGTAAIDSPLSRCCHALCRSRYRHGRDHSHGFR